MDEETKDISKRLTELGVKVLSDTEQWLEEEQEIADLLTHSLPTIFGNQPVWKSIVLQLIR